MDTFVNRIYLYDDKMTVLYNTQDSHSDVTIDDLSSSRVALPGGFNSDIFLLYLRGFLQRNESQVKTQAIVNA